MACFDVMHHTFVSMTPEYFIQENEDTGIQKPVLHSMEEGHCKRSQKLNFLCCRICLV